MEDKYIPIQKRGGSSHSLIQKYLYECLSVDFDGSCGDDSICK